MSWSDLMPEILITIAEKLSFSDHLRFRSVCSSWRSISRSFPVPSLQLPWLLLPSLPSIPIRYFYSFSEDRIYTISLIDALDSNIFGSADGWALTLKDRNAVDSASLTNPFTGACIRLPSLPHGSSISYTGAEAIAWDRSDSIVVVGSKMREGLFYSRPGDPCWTPIESMRYRIANWVTYFEGNFYVLERTTSRTTVLDGESLELVSVIPPPEFKSPTPVQARLVVSLRELLLLVEPILSQPFWERVVGDQFKVSKVFSLDRRSEVQAEWREVAKLGDRALFVDDFHCFSFQAGGSTGLRKNCIYSPRTKSVRYRSLNSTNRTYCISVFNLSDRSFDQIDGQLVSFPVARLNGAYVPSWIMPALS